jgi:hypothetical protein
MSLFVLKRGFILLILLGSTWSSARPAPQMRASVMGIWMGQSICTGGRSACKNEVVVFRVEAIAGKPGMVTLFADKIIGGKREPMSRMDFQYDRSREALSCEFVKGPMHGLIELKMTGDTMEGTLVVLPEKTVGRRIKVKRVSEDQVPPAPDRNAYDGM